jgi:hypothetical protein
MEQKRKTSTKRMLLRAFLALGTAAFLSSATVWAANPAGFTLRVRCADVQAPNAVTDLAASPNAAVEGQIILTWTAPADLPTGDVSSYQVRYATFSVASVGGSTTTWWNLATPFAGVPAPQPAGSFESAVVPSLSSGTYYFAVRSQDAAGNFSPLDDGAVVGPQASAQPKSLAPAPVAGLLALVNPDTSFNVNWSPVVINADGTPALDINDYVVRKSGNLNGPFNVIVSSGAGASSFGFTASSAPVSLEYLQIVAKDNAGNESDPALSNLLLVTPQGVIGQVAAAQDGTQTHAYIPSSIMSELRGNGQDLLMRVSKDTDPNLNKDPRVLATYDVGFVSSAQVVDKNFTLSRPAMNVTLQYTPAPGATEVGVLWFNGVQWIKVGAAQVDTTLNTVSFYTGLPGIYQVRSFQAATSLNLDKANVFPRIFSPNGDGINDRVLFVIENPNGSAVDGKIYDVGGNEVATLAPAGAGAPTAATMAWNGRDRDGRLVRSGVYIYRIKGEGKSMTGTVVVAQ